MYVSGAAVIIDNFEGHYPAADPFRQIEARGCARQNVRNVFQLFTVNVYFIEIHHHIGGVGDLNLVTAALPG